MDRFYVNYLGRASGASERAAWVAAIQGGLTIEQVEANFISSPEFLAHIHTDYVQALYLNILHRTSSGYELAGWTNLLGSLGLKGVAASFATSPEHRTNAAADFIQRFLHRAPAANEAATLAAGPGDLLALEAAVLSGTRSTTTGERKDYAIRSANGALSSQPDSS